MHSSRIIGFAAALALSTIVFSAGSKASPVTWKVSGHVDKVIANRPNVDVNAMLASIGGSASLGDQFTITYTFDPALAACVKSCTPTHGIWSYGILSTVFQVGSWTFTLMPQLDLRFTPPLSNNEINIYVNDPHVGNEYAMSMGLWLDDINGRSSQILAGWYAQAWLSSTPSFVTSTNLTAEPFDLSAFSFVNGPQMSILYPDGRGNLAIVQAPVETVTRVSAVPEPSTLAFFGFLISFSTLRRRTRQ